MESQHNERRIIKAWGVSVLVLDEDRPEGKPEMLNELADFYAELDYWQQELERYKEEREQEIVQRNPDYQLDTYM